MEKRESETKSKRKTGLSTLIGRPSLDYLKTTLLRGTVLAEEKSSRTSNFQVNEFCQTISCLHTDNSQIQREHLGGYRDSIVNRYNCELHYFFVFYGNCSLFT